MFGGWHIFETFEYIGAPDIQASIIMRLSKMQKEWLGDQKIANVFSNFLITQSTPSHLILTNAYGTKFTSTLLTS